MHPEKVMALYEAVEHECRDEIMKYGGSVSHHHGIGKIRKRFVKSTMSPLGIGFQDMVKKYLDPKNIFACNNTIYRRDKEEEEERSRDI
jgi:alkyldihydroxyacetonephosphate synthase